MTALAMISVVGVVPRRGAMRVRRSRSGGRDRVVVRESTGEFCRG